MSKTTHLFLGIGTTLLCVFWCFFGLMMFWGAAVGLDGRGAGLDHPDFIKVYVVFGGGLLGGLWFAFRSFRLAFRSHRIDPRARETSSLGQPKHEESAGTPDERLAHLVKKPRNENLVEPSGSRQGRDCVRVGNRTQLSRPV